MACFVAPMVEAIAVTAVKKVVEKKEIKNESGISWSRKLGWLNKLLWGGSLMLALEHLWHGEIVPYPPFLTAMLSPGGINTMLFEIATTGVAMALFVTITWAIVVIAAGRQSNALNSKLQTEK